MNRTRVPPTLQSAYTSPVRAHLPELRRLAQLLDIKGVKGMKKDKLIAAIVAKKIDSRENT